MTTIMEKTLEMLEAELRAEADKAAAIANDPDQTEDAFKAQKKVMQEKLAAYNKKAAEDAYTAWAAEESPVRKALETLYVPKAKSARVTRNKDTKKYTAVVEDSATLKIDLYHMMQTIGEEHFNDAAWYGAAQRMCFVFAGNLNKELESRTDFAYYLEQAGKAFDFAPDANFTSNNSAVKALQKVVDMIIFDPVETKKGMVNSFEMKKKHYVYIRECLTKQGKKPGEVSMANTAKLIELTCDILYCILNGKELKLVGA